MLTSGEFVLMIHFLNVPWTRRPYSSVVSGIRIESSQYFSLLPYLLKVCLCVWINRHLDFRSYNVMKSIFRISRDVRRLLCEVSVAKFKMRYTE